MKKLWKKFWDWYSYDIPGAFVSGGRKALMFNIVIIVVTIIVSIVIFAIRRQLP